MRRPALRSLTLPVLGLALLAGCATTPSTTTGEAGETRQQTEARAQQLIAQDQILDAARLYRDQLEQAAPADAQYWRLRLVEMLFNAGYNDRALEVLRQFEARPIPTDLRLRGQIVSARAALVTGNAVGALRRLPVRDSTRPPAVRTRIQAVRADALAASGRPGRALAERIEREDLLQKDAAIAANHDAIWRLLQGVSRTRLQQLAQHTTGSTASGWLQLALAGRAATSGDRSIEAALADWRQHFPDHPAAEHFLTRLHTRLAQQLAYPDRIALLLPLSGRFAAAGRAVRDGLLAAYYQQAGTRRRPAISVYDTGANGLSAPAAYDRAVADGATFVLGPLTKPAVAKLAARDTLSVPVLTLNYRPDAQSPPPDGLYQFGLLPEDEARQAAETAISKGHYNALTLLPAGHWGGRMQRAFRQRFTALGGVVLESARYNAKGTDYGRPIRALLNLDRSQARAHRVRVTIHRSVHFSPRRRRDAGVIFMAAQPRQGRLLMPQLKFYRAGDLPTYASSNVYSGTPDPDDDWDLNGLYFTDIPWVLDNLDQPGPLFRDISAQWSHEQKQHPRLLALGIDAYHLIPQLDRLTRHQQASVGGRTGQLTLDDQRRIHRHLQWARFIKGRPVPVSEPEAGTTADDALGADVRERADGN